MGFLDRFRKKNKEEIETHPKTETNRNLEFSGSNFKVKRENSSIQLDFYNPEKSSKFYDTTRLILNDNAHRMISGEDVQTAYVAWYGESDCVMILPGEGEFSRATDYRKILVSIDTNLLLTDPQYRSTVMNLLLDEERVERYLEQGLEDNPQMPCGNYVGGVRMTDKGWRKYFSQSVGRIVHNMPENVSKRQSIKEREEMRKQKRISELQEEINRLQGDSDGWNR